MLHVRWLNLATLLPLWMAACVNHPGSPGRWSTITVPRALEEGMVGRQVRWGGTIAGITPGQHDTCFEVISLPLEPDGRPQKGGYSDGRFIACGSGVYPPGMYEGQEVTVVGTLREPFVERLGDFTNRYPQVAVETVQFWQPGDASPTDWPALWKSRERGTQWWHWW